MFFSVLLLGKLISDTIQMSTVNGQLDQYIHVLAALGNTKIALFHCPNIIFVTV